MKFLPILRKASARAYAVWDLAFSSLALVLTIIGLKEIWSQEGRENYSLRARLALSFFYVAHVAAILLALGFFGEAVIAAPIATLIVSSTSLLNDFFDYFQGMYHSYKRDQEFNRLEEDLRKENFDFVQNLNFFENLLERQSEIDLLLGQREELIEFKNRIESQGTCDAAPYFNGLKEIAETLKQKFDSIVEENKFLDECYALAIRCNGRYQQIVEQTSHQIVEENDRLKKIEKSIIQLENYDRHHPRREVLIQQRDFAKKKIKKIAYVNHYFYKLSKSKEALTDLENQLAELGNKYKSIEGLTLQEVIQLERLEKEYLQERIQSLKSVLAQASKPRAVNQGDINDRPMVDYERLLYQRIVPDQATLLSILDGQIKSIDKMLAKHHQENEDTQKYLRIFSSHPSQQGPQDIAKIVQKAEKIYRLHIERELANIEQRQKLWATRFSIVSALSAAAMFFTQAWKISELFLFAMQSMSILGGILTIASFFVKRESESQQRAKRHEKIESLMKECKLRAEQVRDPHLKNALNKKLSSMLERLLDTKPIAEARIQTRSSQNPRTVNYLYRSKMSPLSRVNPSQRTSTRSQPSNRLVLF